MFGEPHDARCISFFFFDDHATTEIDTDCHTLPLHDSLPIPDHARRYGAETASGRVATLEHGRYHVRATREDGEIIAARGVILATGVETNLAELDEGDHMTAVRDDAAAPRRRAGAGHARACPRGYAPGTCLRALHDRRRIAPGERRNDRMNGALTLSLRASV